MKRLENKVALITGSARGIGKAIAELFAGEGANVIISDINDLLGNQTTRDIKSINVEYKHLDVSNENNWIEISEYIQSKFGKLDILVNNAGITGFIESSGPHNPEDLDMLSWQKVHAVNSNGVALGCKYAIKLMKNKGGTIVNISSRSGLVGIPQAVAYASSKASVRNHTKSVALYCADMGYRIRCNSIHPGAILTPMWDDMLPKDETDKQAAIKAISQDIPLKVMGEAKDVAYAALYLVSDESKYVTGIELNVDGGILAGSSAAPKKV
ncbi:Short-chain dehydrogenase/reductase SDR [Francisella cf. novicida Fx1]|uniref:SDR family oxidoreductase n=1 Tax=Francisella tularensis TaxID=263 RepID=UPI00020BCFD0|nr:SDR family oxidoreductase [Francisella tularensis]AEE87590.1 Short-chain dehydrogenase/reductase SDR [Francisella cf. novicida Fx1]